MLIILCFSVKLLILGKLNFFQPTIIVCYGLHEISDNLDTSVNLVARE